MRDSSLSVWWWFLPPRTKDEVSTSKAANNCFATTIGSGPSIFGTGLRLSAGRRSGSICSTKSSSETLSVFTVMNKADSAKDKIRYVREILRLHRYAKEQFPLLLPFSLDRSSNLSLSGS